MKEYVRTIADYPVEGIQFRDITTLLQNAGHFKQVIDDMVKPWQNKKIDAVLSIESRGFITVSYTHLTLPTNLRV